MNKKLTDGLIKKFPKLFTPKFHFEHDDGWFSIIHETSESLATIQKEVPELKIKVLQVKEKLGTLRYYVNVELKNKIMPESIYTTWVRIIYNIISVAERHTDDTCELCGRFSSLGVKDYNGMLKVLCKEHAEEKIQNTS